MVFGGFLPRHDEDLREPLVRRQGSQVSMRVARGSASWLSQEGRGGSEEAVPGPSVFPSGEPGVSGDFWGSQEGCA